MFNYYWLLDLHNTLYFNFTLIFFINFSFKINIRLLDIHDLLFLRFFQYFVSNAYISNFVHVNFSKWFESFVFQYHAFLLHDYWRPSYNSILLSWTYFVFLYVWLDSLGFFQLNCKLRFRTDRAQWVCHFNYTFLFLLRCERTPVVFDGFRIIVEFSLRWTLNGQSFINLNTTIINFVLFILTSIIVFNNILEFDLFTLLGQLYCLRWSLQICWRRWWWIEIEITLINLP